MLDFRTKDEFNEGHISGAYCMVSSDPGDKPLAEQICAAVEAEYSEIRGADFVLALCGSSDEAAVVILVLEALGIAQWNASAKPTEVWRVAFDQYRVLFPFALRASPELEPVRLFPSIISFEPRVYLSSWALASDPDVFEAILPTHVVNCTPDHAHCFEGRAAYIRVPVDDIADQDIGVHLDPAVNFIVEALAGDGVVLCHCRHGRSRSATVLAAWLVASRGCSVTAAVESLKACRPKVGPNHGFLSQLEIWAAAHAKQEGRIA